MATKLGESPSLPDIEISSFEPAKALKHVLCEGGRGRLVGR
jgi:hypothetical protein